LLQIDEIATARTTRFAEAEVPISIGLEIGPRFAESNSLRAFFRTLVGPALTKPVVGDGTTT
jgi:hypothetical protein